MGKLVRNLSTKKHRDWWKAVSEAASKAPKLTYEASQGPVAKQVKATVCKTEIARSNRARASQK